MIMSGSMARLCEDSDERELQAANAKENHAHEETLHERKSRNPEEHDSADESSIDHHNIDDDIPADAEDENESMP